MPLPVDRERLSFRSAAEDREDRPLRARENARRFLAHRFRDRPEDRRAQAKRKQECSVWNHAVRFRELLLSKNPPGWKSIALRGRSLGRRWVSGVRPQENRALYRAQDFLRPDTRDLLYRSSSWSVSSIMNPPPSS